ncbi:hypothetical protein, partial [Pseudidiomarina gelatinasegens]|uniref:hypothetical protein n=1 Tax=Pseudidiomarina gelatinasegens TaxID=2487740 RepID=UPI001C70A3C1
STFPISQVYFPSLEVPYLSSITCLNPVSAHTVCLAWYIVKERFASREAGCVFYAIRWSGQDPFGSFFVIFITF